MVSKNNRIKKMEESAERQSHFGIRKLTIGAASVLLGTTLWMGVNANNAQAATPDNANESNGNATSSEQTPHEETVNTKNVNKVVVNADSQKTNVETQNDQSQKAVESADVIKSDANAAKTEDSAQTTTQKQEEEVKQNNQVAQNTDTTSSISGKNVNDSASAEVKASNEKATDLSNSGLAGKKANSETTLDLTKDSQDYSEIASLLNSSFVQVPSTKADQVSGTIDANYQDSAKYNEYFGSLSKNELGYGVAELSNGKTISFSTDRSNPGENIYYYLNGIKQGTINGKTSTVRVSKNGFNYTVTSKRMAIPGTKYYLYAHEVEGTGTNADGKVVPIHTFAANAIDQTPGNNSIKVQYLATIQAS